VVSGANRINLDHKHITQYIPAPTRTREDLAYSTEDIQQLLSASTNPRDKLMLLLLTSTGMRVGVLCDLTLADIEPITPKGYAKYIYKIIVYRGHRSQYYTFTTFECAEALYQYLAYRKHNKEVLTKHLIIFRS
jgi:integrase